MRRHGLREWIRHQRRLTRRLVTRHVLARRPNSIARTLERLGVWFDDEPVGALRFVPPLIEGEAAAATAAAPAMERALTGVPDESEELWEGSPRPTVGAAGDKPETPNVAPLLPASEPIAPRGVHAMPTSARTESPPARNAGRAPAVAISTPVRTTETRVPTAPRPVDLVRDLDDAARRVSPRGVEPRPSAAAAAASRASPRDSSTSPVAPSAAPRGAEQAEAPNAASEKAGVERATDQRADSVTSADSELAPAASDRTPHGEIVERALAALRASGELRAATGDSPARRRPQPHPPAPPPTRSSPVGPPAIGSAQVASPPPASPAETAPPTPLAMPSPPRSAESDVPAGVELPTDIPPLDAAESDGVADRPIVPQSEGSPSEPGAARTAERDSAHAEDGADAAPPIPKVDEQRQARRPAHLDRARSEPPASSSTPTREAASSPSRRADRAPDTAGQFRFTEVDRTPQEWQRLLFEATSPPSPTVPRKAPAIPHRQVIGGPSTPRSTAAPRRAETALRAQPSPAPTSRAQSPGVTPTQRAPGAASRRVPNDVTGSPAAAPTGTRTTPPRHAVPAAPLGQDEPAIRAATADDAASERDAGDDPLRAGSAQPTYVAEIMRTVPWEPVSPSARRFLRPLVGIDPDTVRIHRGERASELADQLRADAMAVGDDVALGAAHDDRDPRTIALLAHELTHAAGARDRRFVPPIARGTRGASGTAADTTSAARYGGSGAMPEPAPIEDEEALAQLVETRVRAAAERVQELSVTPNADLDADLDGDGLDGVLPDGDPDTTTDAAPIAAPALPRRPASAPRVAGARPSPWGVLPAPWEPLPVSLITSRPADVPAAVTTPVVAAPSPPPTPPSTAPVPELHLAEHGRASAGEEPAHADAPQHAGGSAPDIDALARQVYTVLKRRLAAERRRGA